VRALAIALVLAAAPAAATPQAATIEARAAATAKAVGRLTGSIAEAEAEAGEASRRIAILDRQRAALNARIAAEQRALTPLLAALASEARRPPALLLADPARAGEAARLGVAVDALAPTVRTRTATLRKSLAEAEALEATLVAERGKLLAARARLDRDVRLLTRLGSRLAAEARTLRELTEGLDDQPVRSPPRLAIAMPVRGAVATRFGDRTRFGMHSSGVTWRVPPGRTVESPAAGRVAFAGPFRTYGRIVIIEHGAGVLSLLAGFGRIAVAPGQAVTAGAALGTVADRGELYFELRASGSAVDPEQWAASTSR
jgi:septal ring factor EnvC (AmiA/AmiB activator)